MATQNEKAVIDLVINGQQAQAALTEVGKAATVARRELSKMREADDPGAFAKKMKEYQTLAAAETDMKNRLNGTAKGWAGFKQNVVGTLTGVLGGNLLTAGLQQLIGLAPVVLDHSLKMADSFADIAKNADMSTQQVEALNEKLYKMPTRTSTEDLRAMAATGGQFGVAAKEMDKFVDGANRVNVAIGDEFGSVEATVENVLGLRNVFSNIKSDNIDQDLLHIGNAMNVLGAEGKATAPMLSDFSNRMGGVLIPLGLVEGKVLGLSATLSELNVTAERGSTATVNIFQKMLTETETFAKVAGAPLKEYRDLIKNDIYGAFTKYIEGLKKVSGNQVEFMAVLEKSKLTGAGEMEVLSKLASNTELLAQKSDRATVALTHTDSITAEYNKKNLDLAVNLKKLADLKEQLLTKLIPLASGFVSLTTKLLGLKSATEESSLAFENQRSVVKSLEKDTLPLLKRHDELKGKTKLTKDEQTELNKVIATIAQTIPSAVTQFDSMGNAMAISTEKARAYVKQQKEVLKYTNRQAIADTDSELEKARKEQLRLLEARKRGTVGEGGTSATDRYRERPMTNAEAMAAQAAVEAKNAEIAALETRRAGLSGDYLDEKESTRRRNERRAAEAAASGGQPGIAPPTDGPGIDLGESKEEKATEAKRKRELKAAERHQDDYAKLLEEARARTAQARDNEFEKEQIQFGTHYARLLELAGSDKTKQAEVSEAMYIELAAIQDKADKKAREAAEKAREEARKDQQAYDKLMVDMAVAQLEKLRDADLAANNLAHAGGKISDNVHQATELTILQQFLEAKLTLQQVYAQDVASTEADITQNLQEQNNLRAAINKQDAQDRQDLQNRVVTRQWKALEKLASDERLSERQRIEAKEALRESQMQYVSEGISGLKLMVGEHTVAYKAMFAAERAYTIAKIAMNTYKEISDVWANPQFTLLGFGGPVVKGLFTALAVARGAAAAASVSGIAMKDDGGFTDVDSLYGGASGFKTKPTMVNKGAGSYMVGEQRQEWIMGGAMLQNPVMANLAHALEAVQVTGAYRNMGSLSGASGGSQAVSVSTPGMNLAPLLFELQQMRGELSKIKNLKVVNNYRAFEEYRDDVAQLRTQNTL
ncbi:phage tail tape measure protein [Fibrella forsythiae]|uniref:Phage tail tape measure protein n=1 Tax=Fibrella forsythiae TaxID=2817061 RepID=A0ABS3JAE4_9BACT|nr:phage tail tape measure protein [Fibrella forsythiae]MBO0946965.1 phage tail tape measure protein [Fibrella forsythiae]